MASKVKVDEKMFRAIKIMCAGGASNGEISEFFHLSKCTVSYCRNSETYQEYRNILAAIHAKKPSRIAKKQQNELTVVEPVPAPENAPEKAPDVQIVEHRQSVTIQATHFMQMEQKKANENLELISRKLTAIMETLDELLKVWKSS